MFRVSQSSRFCWRSLIYLGACPEKENVSKVVGVAVVVAAPVVHADSLSHPASHRQSSPALRGRSMRCTYVGLHAANNFSNAEWAVGCPRCGLHP
eukprot:7836249-Pyramimonas_sp.AAC.1